jgi:hypothetical protein
MEYKIIGISSEKTYQLGDDVDPRFFHVEAGYPTSKIEAIRAFAIGKLSPPNYPSDIAHFIHLIESINDHTVLAKLAAFVHRGYHAGYHFFVHENQTHCFYLLEED